VPSIDDAEKFKEGLNFLVAHNMFVVSHFNCFNKFSSNFKLDLIIIIISSF